VAPAEPYSEPSNVSKSSRRFKILLLCVLLLVLASLALALASFDLNSYRQQLAASLSRTLNQPVTIGSLHFSYTRGLALDCSELQIGDPARSRFSLATREISLRLRLLPLFSRQLQFSRITLHQPVITLRPAATDTPDTVSGPEGLGSWLQQTRISNLQLQGGRLLWHRLGSDRQAADAELQLDLEIDNLRPGRRGSIELQGALLGDHDKANFELAGSVEFPGQLADWPHWQSVVHGSVDNFDPRHWLALYLGKAPGWSIEKIARGELMLEGAPATGLRIALEVAGENLAVGGAEFSRPVTLPPLLLQANWQETAGRHRFSNIQLQMGEIDLGGNLELERTDSDWDLELQAEGRASLEQLLGLFPDQGALARAVSLRSRLHGGNLTLQSLQLHSSLAELPDALDRLRFTARLSDLTIAVDPGHDLTLARADFSGASGALSILRGDLTWFGTPLQLGGQVGYGDSRPGTFDLTLSGSPEAGTIAPLARGWLDGLEGVLPAELQLSGDRNRLDGKLSVDLSSLRGGIGKLLQLPEELPGQLDADFSLTPDALTLNTLRLQLPKSEILGSGHLELAAPHSYLLQLQVAKLALAPLRSYSPLLERLQLQGALQGELQLSGLALESPHLTGRLDLQGGGVHLTRVIGDLSALDGGVAFTGQGLRSIDLHGRLGQSAVDLQAQIEDFAHPSVRVRVQGETLQANDLIFPSQSAVLHDLDGRLFIDGQGIRFETVRVRLPGGTQALVRGMMHGYAKAHVALRIDADYGNIDEVIALWHRDEPSPPRPPGSVGPTVAIDIFAKQGKIGDLTFSDAFGELSVDGQGHLVIYPLKFAHDQGYGVGHVSVDSTVEGPALLKISGHVEKFDAAAIHQQLLHRTSLVSGTLRGDFYLEGRAGESFVPTSRGGFSARISDGELKRFRILGKVFSLLNVSQLFSFQLPDMSAEGMPFDELTATARLDKGVLRTEDLLIHSNAMDIGLVTDYNLNSNELDGVLAIKPLKTVDSLISKIPIAGWIIAGEDKALVTAQFTLKGKASDPEVSAAPVSSLSRPVLGIFKRILQLPGKLASDMAGAISGEETSAPGPLPEAPERN